MARKRRNDRDAALRATLDAVHEEARQRLSMARRALLAGAGTKTPPEALIEALRRELAEAPEERRGRILMRIALAIADLKAMDATLRWHRDEVRGRLGQFNRYRSAMTSYARWGKPKPVRTQGFHGAGRFQEPQSHAAQFQAPQFQAPQFQAPRRTTG